MGEEAGPARRRDRPSRAAGPGLSAATAVVGVIGDPVAHSLSPRLHNAAFAELGLDWVSVGFRVAGGRTSGALSGGAALGLRGLSVTMPHKEAAAAAVDRLTAAAARLGAVNCVAFEEGRSVGENTDGPGLIAALRRGGEFDPAGRRCLVVGAGGAARAAVASLAEAGAAEVVVVNRTAGRAATAARLAGAAGRVGTQDQAAGCDLVVNATPLGMAAHGVGDPVVDADGADSDGGPRVGGWPVDPAYLRAGQLVVDLVYHPPRTSWLAAAAAAGARVQNGIGMLVHQAALQVARWTGEEAPVEAMWRAAKGDGPDASG